MAHELGAADARLLNMQVVACLQQHNLHLWTAALELIVASSCAVQRILHPQQQHGWPLERVTYQMIERQRRGQVD